MTPERKIEIDGHLIEEYYWAGKLVVYLDHRVIDQTYEEVQKMVRALHER